MAQHEKGNITHNKKTYKFEYFDTSNLLRWYKAHDNLAKSLIKLMKAQRNREFNIMDFIIEDYKALDQNKRNYYLFIHNNKELIAISRISIGKKDARISAVHTNKKYRSQGFCQKNLTKLIQITNKIHKTTKYTIGVDSENIPAISCYKNLGFVTKKTCKDAMGTYYEMVLSSQNNTSQNNKK